MTTTPYTPKVGDKVRLTEWAPNEWAAVEWRRDHCASGVWWNGGPWHTNTIDGYELWVEPKPTVAQRLQAAHEQVVNYDSDDLPHGHFLARVLDLDPASTGRIVVLPDPQEGQTQWLVTCESRRVKCDESYVAGPIGSYRVEQANHGLWTDPAPVVISVVPAP